MSLRVVTIGDSEQTINTTHIRSMKRIQAAAVFLACAVDQMGSTGSTFDLQRIIDKQSGEVIGDYQITVRRIDRAIESTAQQKGEVERCKDCILATYDLSNVAYCTDLPGHHNACADIVYCPIEPTEPERPKARQG